MKDELCTHTGCQKIMKSKQTKDKKYIFFLFLFISIQGSFLGISIHLKAQNVFTK